MLTVWVMLYLVLLFNITVIRVPEDEGMAGLGSPKCRTEQI